MEPISKMKIKLKVTQSNVKLEKLVKRKRLEKGAGINHKP